jgi:hypothetical protein
VEITGGWGTWGGIFDSSYCVVSCLKTRGVDIAEKMSNGEHHGTEYWEFMAFRLYFNLFVLLQLALIFRIR